MTLNYSDNISVFCGCHHEGQLTTLPSFFFMSFVYFSTHFDEDSNKIIDFPHTVFIVSVENIFTKEVFMINTWVLSF